jgi:hypothetical protein
MAGYCTRGDLYSYGLPRGAIPNPGRNPSGVDATANTITLGEHGFELNDPVSFRADAPAGGALPGGLSAGTTYYAIPVTDDTFKVSATADGAAVDITSAGSRFVAIAPLPVAAAIEYGARQIDDMLPAHVVPLTAPYPEIIVATNAELAMAKLGSRANSQTKSLADVLVHATKRIERWAKDAIPVRGEGQQPASNLATSVVAPALDPDGWVRFGGT